MGHRPSQTLNSADQIPAPLYLEGSSLSLRPLRFSDRTAYPRWSDTRLPGTGPMRGVTVRSRPALLGHTARRRFRGAFSQIGAESGAQTRAAPQLLSSSAQTVYNTSLSAFVAEVPASRAQGSSFPLSDLCDFSGTGRPPHGQHHRGRGRGAPRAAALVRVRARAHGAPLRGHALVRRRARAPPARGPSRFSREHFHTVELRVGSQTRTGPSAPQIRPQRAPL